MSNKFEMCEDCRADAATANMYRLCCATRRVMNHAVQTLPIRQEYAKRIAQNFGHDIMDMRTMAGELRAFWKRGAK